LSSLSDFYVVFVKRIALPFLSFFFFFKFKLQFIMDSFHIHLLVSPQFGTGQSAVMLCGWEVITGIAHSTCEMNMWVAGKTV